MTMATAGTSAEQQAAQEMLAAILAACNNQQQDNGWRSNPQELLSQQMHYGDAPPNMFSHGLTEEQLLQDRQAALTQQLHMVETMLAQSRAQPMAQQPKQVQIEQPRYPVPPGEITYPRNANSGKTGPAVGHAMPLPPGLTLQLAAAGIDVQKSTSDDSGGQAWNASKGQTEQPNLETMPVKAGVGTSDKKAQNGREQREKVKNARVEDSDNNTRATHACPQARHQDTLKGHLSDLKDKDSKCVFVARDIKDLGFHSKDLLKQYFSAYGEVKDVLVAHTKAKSRRNGISDGDAVWSRRFRPGNFGLVVMENPEVVQRVFSAGSMQIVNGVRIQVQVFEHPANAQERPSSPDDTNADDSRSGDCSDKQPSSGHVSSGHSGGGCGQIDGLLSPQASIKAESELPCEMPPRRVNFQNPNNFLIATADSLNGLPAELALPLKSILDVAEKLQGDSQKASL